MANYLLTGAAGFIGFRVAQVLMDAGHTVSGVDNLNNAYDVRMKDHRLALLCTSPNFCFYRIDISQRETIEGMFIEQYERSKQPPFDAVINLAARAGVRQSLENPWVYMDTNITGTLNLLELCRRYGIHKFVLASTSSIYGEDAPLPTPEEANSSQPLQPYAASKKGAEVLSYTYHFLYGIDVTVFRYFTVYGPAARPDMVMFRFTQWISEGRPVKVNGDGEQSRGFTYLDDIARGTILGLKPLGYEVINLGGHQVIKINELITMIENLSGRKAQVEYLPRHPADMFANWANIDKAKRLLGWQPQVGLEKGVSNLVKWYNTERSWASQIETN
jgi:nucleoside-diphosphate-sugar epimerase